MGTTCLTVCPACNRHVRDGEQACPFCGARVASFLRVLEYRLKTRLNRGRGFSLGAALTAVGIATASNEVGCAVYGGPCLDAESCQPRAGSGGGGATSGGSGGWTGSAGTVGYVGGNTNTAGSNAGGSGAGGHSASGAGGQLLGGASAGGATIVGGSGGEATAGGSAGANADESGGGEGGSAR